MGIICTGCGKVMFSSKEAEEVLCRVTGRRVLVCKVCKLLDGKKSLAEISITEFVRVMRMLNRGM